MSSERRPERKVFVAANPWPLAAKAKEHGLPTEGRYYEADMSEDKVYVIDLNALSDALGGLAVKIAEAARDNT